MKTIRKCRVNVLNTFPIMCSARWICIESRGLIYVTGNIDEVHVCV